MALGVDLFRTALGHNVFFLLLHVSSSMFPASVDNPLYSLVAAGIMTYEKYLK